MDLGMKHSYLQLIIIRAVIISAILSIILSFHNSNNVVCRSRKSMQCQDFAAFVCNNTQFLKLCGSSLLSPCVSASSSFSYQPFLIVCASDSQSLLRCRDPRICFGQPQFLQVSPYRRRSHSSIKARVHATVRGSLTSLFVVSLAGFLCFSLISSLSPPIKPIPPSIAGLMRPSGMTMTFSSSTGLVVLRLGSGWASSWGLMTRPTKAPIAPKKPRPELPLDEFFLLSVICNGWRRELASLFIINITELLTMYQSSPAYSIPHHSARSMEKERSAVPPPNKYAINPKFIGKRYPAWKYNLRQLELERQGEETLRKQMRTSLAPPSKLVVDAATAPTRTQFW